MRRGEKLSFEEVMKSRAYIGIVVFYIEIKYNYAKRV